MEKKHKNKNSVRVIPKKYSDRDKYKIWFWGDNLIVYDIEEKRKFSVKKVVKTKDKTKYEKQVKSRANKLKTKYAVGKRKEPSIARRKTRIKRRKGTSTRYSHLYKCNCILPPNAQSPKGLQLKRNYYRERTHFYWYSSYRGIPSNKEAIEKHDKHYPDHILQTLSYQTTKLPSRR